MNSLFLKNLTIILCVIFLQGITPLFSLGYSNIVSNESMNVSSSDDTEETAVSIPFVTPDFISIGDPKNRADISGYGAVATPFQIARNAVTVSQYTAMLNVVALSDPHGLYSESMGEKGSNIIYQKGSPGIFQYTYPDEKKDDPVTNVSWFSAIRYCNWLHNDQPIGTESSSTTEEGAYSLACSMHGACIAHHAAAKYFLADENQCFKAACYIGGKHPSYDFSVHEGYGTLGMLSDLHEWTATMQLHSDSLMHFNSRAYRIVNGGGSGNHTITRELLAPETERNNIGFRIAAPPLNPQLAAAANETMKQIEMKDPVLAASINHQALKVAILLLMALLANKLFSAILGYVLAIAFVVALILAFGPAAFTAIGMEAAAGTLEGCAAWIAKLFSSGAVAEGGTAAGNTLLQSARGAMPSLNRAASAAAHRIEGAVATEQTSLVGGAASTAAKWYNPWTW